jgi:hypothetical protein
MTQIQIELPCKPHANQYALINSTTRFNVIAAGRRFGKTEAAKIRTIYRAPQQRVWWLMPSYESGQSIWREFENTFHYFPHTYINRSERLIQFPGGGFLQVKSADAKLRSAGLDHVVIDEAAFIDGNLWDYVIRPMLLEGQGSADFLSSTNGRNWFWKLHQQGLDPNEPDWASWHFTSYDNPLLSRSEIDDIRRNTPERVFQQEYLAEFLEDGGAVFRNLTACIDKSIVIDHERGVYPETSGRVVFGVDWARHGDYTVIVAIDTVTKRVVDIDRFHQIDWTLQRGRLEAMARRWKPIGILAESNSIGEPNIEELQKASLPVTGFQTLPSTKPGLINALALAFEQGDIAIPNDATLLGELQAYTLERLPGGTFRYTAPSGMHDDCVIALALAWQRSLTGHLSMPIFIR